MLNFITKLLSKTQTNTSVAPTKQSIGSIFGTSLHKSNFDIAFSSVSYSCAKLRADAVSSLKFNVFYDYGNGERELVEPEHWMNKIMKRPNPHMSWKSLLIMVQLWLDYNGNAYIQVENNGLQYPTQFYVLQSDNVKIKMGEYGPAYYIYEYGGKRTEYHPSEIIHIKNLLPGSEPKDDFVGKSIVGRALDIIKADNELNGYLKRYFANDTIPPYILKSQDELEETQIQHFLTKWNNKLPGHKMMGVLTGGMEAVALSNNSGFSGSISDVNKLLMEKISIIFGIPFQKLTGAATSVASAEVSDFSFRMDTIEPLAFEIVSAINILLANHDPYLVIDFEEFNYESKADSIKQEENDIKYGVLTINEVRSKRGLEPVEWGNAPYGQEATPDKIVD